MAQHEMYKISDLQSPLADEGISLSDSQIHRLVTRPPTMIRPELLLALLRILGCDLDDLLRETTSKPAQGSRGTRKPAEVPLPRPVDVTSDR